MSKRIGAALFALLIAGGFYAVGAQQTTSPQKEEGYVPYTYTAKFYGFVTSSMDIRQGYKATPEAIRTNVAEKGARYMLYNAHDGRIALDFPPEKLAPFAGQRVYVYGSTIRSTYGSGPSASDAASGGFAGGGNEARAPMNTLKVISITPTDHKDTYDNYPEERAR